MVAPAAPTALTLTAKGTSFGAATLGWTHAGTTKYQVVYKRPYDSNWKTLHLANAAAFGTASPYALEVPLTGEIQFAVRAINAAGEASALSTAYASTLEIDGTWFLPFVDNAIDDAAWAWIGGGSPEMRQERDGTLLTVPSREDAISTTTGIVHLGMGESSGLLLTRHGLSGDEWRTRLTGLIRNQKRYRWVWLASPREMFKCELIGPITRTSSVAGGRAYTYSVGIRELR